MKKLHKILEARTASLEWGEVGEQNEYDKKKQANPYNNCGAGGKPSLFLGNVFRLVILGMERPTHALDHFKRSEYISWTSYGEI